MNDIIQRHFVSGSQNSDTSRIMQEITNGRERKRIIHKIDNIIQTQNLNSSDTQNYYSCFVHAYSILLLVVVSSSTICMKIKQFTKHQFCVLCKMNDLSLIYSSVFTLTCVRWDKWIADEFQYYYYYSKKPNNNNQILYIYSRQQVGKEQRDVRRKYTCRFIEESVLTVLKTFKQSQYNA